MSKWMAILLLAAATCQAATLEFSTLDGSLWRCQSDAPQAAWRMDGAGPVGSKSNLFNGGWYWIDVGVDVLMRDGDAVGPLSWYDGVRWDVQPAHGFAIDEVGIGWIAGQDADDAPGSFLVRVSLDSGAVVPIGELSGTDLIVDGLSVVPEPKVETLWLVFLLVLCVGEAKRLWKRY